MAETSHAGRTQPQKLLYVTSPDGGDAEFRLRLSQFAARWEMTVAHSQNEAWSLLQRQPFAGFVLDRDPLGAELRSLLVGLGEARTGVARFVWCSGDDAADLMPLQSQRPVLLFKEWQPELLHSTLERGRLIETWLAQEALKRVLVHLKVLPVLPAIYEQVVKALEDPHGSLEFVARLISRDPVMTAKLLHLANSAFFRRSDPVESPMQAVMMLGSERVRGLVLATQVFSRLEGVAAAGLALDPEWNHAMDVAGYATRIARLEGCTAQQSEVAFTAGLLHDVGRLLLAANLPEAYRRLLQQSKGQPDLLAAEELRVLGTSHADVGALQLAVWGLPLPVLEATAWHHTPQVAQQTTFTTLTAVHIANVLAREKQVALAEEPPLRMDPAYLGELGLRDRRNRWREACDLLPRPEEEADAAVREDRQQAKAP